MLRTQLVAACLLTAMGTVWMQLAAAQATEPCGTVVRIDTHAGSSTRYSWVPGRVQEGQADSIAVILLVGGGGAVDIDDAGCPRRLNANILVRTAPLLQAAGVATVLVDAPSDWRGGDGLAGFRMASEHAKDIGLVIQDVRQRTGASAVWVIGHSRGSLSAANAAAHLAGPNAPDGTVLVSAMLVGEASGRKPWAAQTVFGAGLQTYRGALLVLGQAADNCTRSPAERMDALAPGAQASRLQVARVTGGPRSVGRASSLAGCEVHEAHDFVDQDEVFAQGVLRFMRGGRF